MDERAHAVMTGAGALQDLLDLLAVGEADRGAGRIDSQLPGKIAGEPLFVGEQQLFQLVIVVVLPSIRYLVVGIDG